MLDGLELISAIAHNIENSDDPELSIVPHIDNYTGNIFY